MDSKINTNQSPPQPSVLIPAVVIGKKTNRILCYSPHIRQNGGVLELIPTSAILEGNWILVKFGEERKVERVEKLNENEYNRCRIPPTSVNEGRVSITVPFIRYPEFDENKKTEDGSLGKCRKVYMLNMGIGDLSNVNLPDDKAVRIGLFQSRRDNNFESNPYMWELKKVMREFPTLEEIRQMNAAVIRLRKRSENCGARDSQKCFLENLSTTTNPEQIEERKENNETSPMKHRFKFGRQPVENTSASIHASSSSRPTFRFGVQPQPTLPSKINRNISAAKQNTSVPLSPLVPSSGVISRPEILLRPLRAAGSSMQPKREQIRNQTRRRRGPPKAQPSSYTVPPVQRPLRKHPTITTPPSAPKPLRESTDPTYGLAALKISEFESPYSMKS
ncbi:hypothetical protein CRE_18507 [Caenorhabditis remanei]|uniref:Uncharacterized protein n=1 Tax=Caenorhabditis remanei TaxID=31234 RepID=E3LL03_CAERE|nr:hypothetical protein CRE_18507 [Caenorhabditis remanei]